MQVDLKSHTECGLLIHPTSDTVGERSPTLAIYSPRYWEGMRINMGEWCENKRALQNPQKIMRYMDVSENSGTPKSSILTGFSTINHPFWGTPIFGSTHIVSFIFFLIFLPYNSSPFSKEIMDLFSKIRKSKNSSEWTDSTTPKGWWNFRDFSTGAKRENDP